VLEVWVTTPPVEGAANRPVPRAVVLELGVPVSALSLDYGGRGRLKTVEVGGR
jgi:uncharacterized protein YggU (UPF0235/DUF167 family)